MMDPDVWSAIGTCVSAMVGIGALIGLVYYVRYTRRMMNATEESLRASTRPLITVEKISAAHSEHLGEIRAIFEISNIGNGPAVMLAFYGGDLQRLGKFIPEPTTEDVGWIDMLPKHGSTKIENLKTPAPHQSDLIILPYKDLAGNEYQTHVQFSIEDTQDNTTSFGLVFVERPRRESS
jgi:hypothetical protein